MYTRSRLILYSNVSRKKVLRYSNVCQPNSWIISVTLAVGLRLRNSFAGASRKTSLKGAEFFKSA